MTDPAPTIGRCQHCQQVRPVWHHDKKFDNGDSIWDTPYPEYWLTTGAWLCARCYSAAETARVNGLTFHVEHEAEVKFWRCTSPAATIGRIFTPDGGELLTQTDQDLKTCQAIWAVGQ